MCCGGGWRLRWQRRRRWWWWKKWKFKWPQIIVLLHREKNSINTMFGICVPCPSSLYTPTHAMIVEQQMHWMRWPGVNAVACELDVCLSYRWGTGNAMERRWSNNNKWKCKEFFPNKCRNLILLYFPEKQHMKSHYLFMVDRTKSKWKLIIKRN